MRDPDTSRVRLIRWNPKRMRLRVHPITQEIKYYYEMDPLFITKLDKGDEFLLNTTPMPLLKAAANSDRANARMFEFSKDAIYHLKEPTLSGIPVRGWGIPPILPNFKLAYYIQLMRRYDEAIALDFIVPFRILYPSTSPGGADPLSAMSMQNFMGHMNNMVANKRKNITDIQIAPFPIGYQAVGGEGRDLAPKDSISFAVDELLNAVGFPAELYKATLSIQAFPVALRLFEKSWGMLVDGNNDLISWIIKRISRHYMWGKIDGKLRSVTLADDIERKALALQAAAGMDISKATAYRPLGIDYSEEQKRIIEEQEVVAKLQQEAMERQQSSQGEAQGGGGGQQGGAPQPGMMEPGATPGDVYEQGKALAQQLLTQTPENMRRGELIKIKHSNPTLHAIVLQEMDNMRNQMRSEGQAMMMQQAQQQGAAGQAKTAEYDDTAVNFAHRLLINDQLMDYNRKDLQKIAVDISRGIKGAREAFHYVHSAITGRS